MKPEIKFEDWMKVNLIVGEIVEIKKEIIKINCGDKIRETKNIDLSCKNGDKMIIGILNDRIIIPIINNKVHLIPEKSIEPGSSVS